MKVCVCKWCAEANITTRSFGAKEHVYAGVLLELVRADRKIYLKYPSLEGY